jgi:hypothetical protein
LNHLAFGYNRFRNKNVSNSFNDYLDGTDWKSELGLTGFVGSGAFIDARFNGNIPALGNLARWGHQGTGNNPNGSTIIQDDFTWLRGNHSFRMGAEHRRYYLNSNAVFTPPVYFFHSENTSQPGFDGTTGFSFASFMLGSVRNTTEGIPQLSPGQRSRTYSFYFQDDWKASSKLTLNIGIRWDIASPIKEVSSRMSGLDPNLTNPATGNKGAFVVLGDGPGRNGQDNFAKTYYRQFGPRFGFAYAASQKMVVRGGYGINFSPPIGDGFSWPYTQGFNGQNPIVQRTGRFLQDPSYNWDNPYPAFTRTLPNTDPTLLNGIDIPYYSPEVQKLPYVQNWNFGIQYELPWQTRVEANYVGNKGTRLNDVKYANFLNQVDPVHLRLGDALVEDISLHPEIAKPYPTFTGTVAQALRPFPQYQAVTTHRTNNGYSTYHSMQLTFTKRSNNGLSFLTSYTFSKSLATTDTAGPGDYTYNAQNIYNIASDYGVTAFHSPHDLKVTWIYDMPFGKQGKWLRSGVGNYILGGWSASMIHRYQTGAPISVSTSNYDSLSLFNRNLRPDVILPPDQQTVGGSFDSVDVINGTQYLNPAAFKTPELTSKRVPTHMGTAPRFLPNVRGFSRYGEDFSLIKKTDLGFREGAFFEIRIDALNIFNRIGLGAPITDVGNANFGKVFNKAGGPRTMQIGARISF